MCSEWRGGKIKILRKRLRNVYVSCRQIEFLTSHLKCVGGGGGEGNTHPVL